MKNTLIHRPVGWGSFFDMACDAALPPDPDTDKIFACISVLTDLTLTKDSKDFMYVLTVCVYAW